jgi:hypothetical protein
VALSALSVSCGQVEQPRLFEEAVGPSAVIGSALGFAFAFGSFAQDTAYPSPHPAIEVSERVYLTVTEVVIPSSQDGINSGDSAP